ncbi:non-ribosomal peptide synthetase [Actomonas aquatica]|uniref:Non-ribosomal peptide synthetase n=1 Tax=Actomonas aquatica TaxID=2866162 RepID=A0ABZ1C446_9BACT|nr:non-ribosomal peptide synthetase [Opitutus sp. WL0086]WRQ86487.1 non-ribosomal peptide synthetase [Opitutus sp. WL0086]
METAASTRLFGSIERFGARLALLRPGGEAWTHAELAVAADRWAALHLSGPDCGRRGLVAIEMAPEFEAIVALVGACRAGWPVLLLGEGKLASEQRLRRQFKPEVEWTREATGWRVRRDAWQALPPEPVSLPVEPPPLPGELPAMELELAVREEAPAEPHEELAMLLTTSGSTGEPKLVRLSTRNLVSNAMSIAWYLGIEPDERAITSLPLHYSYGLSVLTSHLLHGAALVLSAHSVSERAFWEDFELGGATSFAGVPLMYETLAHLGMLERPLSGLRTLTQAGGRLEPVLVKRFADWAAAQGTRFYVMYGQTEAAPRMAFLPPEQVAAHPDCIGQAVPGGELRVENEAGEVIDEDGVAGELVYRGPNVMMGYATARADLARGAEVAELRTGDIAERTRDGLWRIVGRSSRFVKIAGLRVSLDGIESDLREVGVRAKVAGDDRRIVIGVVEPGVPPAGLAGVWSRRLGVPARAVRVVALREVPVLANGKTDHAAILARGGPVEQPGADSALRRELASILGRERLDDEESFVSAGGDSLNLVEGAIAVERFYGERVPGWECLPMAELCRENPDTLPERGRDDPLLVARSIALWLAMSAHVVFKFDLWQWIPKTLVATAFATPLLLVVFGWGLARKFARDGVRLWPWTAAAKRHAAVGGRLRFREVSRWCWPLAGTYYGAIVITMLAQGVGGEMTWEQVGRALYFNEEGIYAGIWMTYFWMVLVAPFLVWPVKRWGVLGVLVVTVPPWWVWQDLTRAPEVNYFWGHVFGWGGVTGPSVLHATSFVVFGFLLGGLLSRWWKALLVVGVLVWTGWLFNQHLNRLGLETVWQLLAYQEYRRLTHPVYMAFGATGALLFTSIGWVMARVPRSPASLRDIFYSFGRSSVFAYVFGNIILVFTPQRFTDAAVRLVATMVPPGWSPELVFGLVYGVVFLLGLALITDDVTRWRPRMFGRLARGLRAGNLWLMRVIRPRRRAAVRG